MRLKTNLLLCVAQSQRRTDEGGLDLGTTNIARYWRGTRNCQGAEPAFSHIDLFPPAP